MTLVKPLVKSLASTGLKGQDRMAIDKKVHVNGDSVTFTMGVKKDSFAKVQHEIKVTCDVTGINRTTLLQNNFSGSSMRVKLQNGHMRKQTEQTLERYGREGYKTSWKAIDDGFTASPVDLLMALNRDDFIETMAKMGIEREQAIRIYNHKHDLPVTSAPKTGDGNPTS